VGFHVLTTRRQTQTELESAELFCVMVSSGVKQQGESREFSVFEREESSSKWKFIMALVEEACVELNPPLKYFPSSHVLSQMSSRVESSKECQFA
jgi:hypothetical protein